MVSGFQLSLIISISMILTMVVAGLFGILVPVTLKKMNIDPAIASSVFVNYYYRCNWFCFILRCWCLFFIIIRNYLLVLLI